MHQTIRFWRAGMSLCLLRCFIGFLGCLVMMFASVEARADLCDDPRMITEAAKYTPRPPLTRGVVCYAKLVPYLDAAGTHIIEIAWILRDVQVDWDTQHAKWDAFALLPDGELLALGEDRAIPLPSYNALGFALRRLGINIFEAGGVFDFRFSLMFAATFERRDEQLCVIYRMKPPFRGEFLDCNGYDEPTGEIGYGPGAISWIEARRIGCGTWKLRQPVLCDVLNTTLERDPDGILFWRVPVRSKVPTDRDPRTPEATPIHYEIYTYRVDVVGGKLTVIGYEIQPAPGERLQP